MKKMKNDRRIYAKGDLLIVEDRPKPPPKPKRRYGLMELQDEDAREKAAVLLGELARVMDLIHGTSGCAGLLDSGGVDRARRQAYGAIHHHLGDLLLGDDNPGWEEYT